MTFPVYVYSKGGMIPPLQDNENMCSTAILNYHRLGVWSRMPDIQNFVRIEIRKYGCIQVQTLCEGQNCPTQLYKHSAPTQLDVWVVWVNGLATLWFSYYLVVKHHHDEKDLGKNPSRIPGENGENPPGMVKICMMNPDRFMQAPTDFKWPLMTS